MSSKNSKTEKGFTIIELVIVIAVIAILSAVLVPTFSNVIENSNVSSDKALIRNINNALEINNTLYENPDDVFELKEVLNKNGIDNISNKTKNHIFYWSKEQNVCFIWGIKEQQIIFPEYSRNKSLDDFNDEIDINNDDEDSLTPNAVTNLVPSASDYMLNYCIGYLNNARLSKSKIVRYAEGYVATGAIKINYAINEIFTIYIAGALFDGNSFSAINVFNEGYREWDHDEKLGNNLTEGLDIGYGLKLYELNDKYYKIVCEDVDEFKTIAYQENQYGDVYFAISLLGNGENLIITLNEKIYDLK